MPYISEMPPPGALTGLELIPMLQGGGADGNVGVPLLVHNPAFGGDVLTLRVPMVADMSAATEADPGAAGVRWNNADPDSATELYINDADGDSGDLAALFASLTVGGFIYLHGAADSEARDNLQRWRVTSKSDESGYTKVGVALEASGGAFADDDVLELTIQQPAPSPGIDRNVLTSVASVSGAATYDASLGDYFQTTLSEDLEDFTITNVPTACTLGWWITQDSTPRAVTWPASFDWGKDNAPTSVPTAAGAVLFVIASTRNAGGKWDVSAREQG